MIPSCNMFGDLNPFPFAVESDDHSEDPSLTVDTETEVSNRKRLPGNENRIGENGEEKSEDKKENSLSFSNTNLEPVARRDDLPKGDKTTVKDLVTVVAAVQKEEDVCKKEEEEQDQDEERGKGGEGKEQEEGERKTEGKEQDGLEKILAATDTVVIFPESVSDQEDHQEGDSQTTAEEEYILKCVHCTETFTRASLLRDHLRSSHPDLPVKYQCPKCEDTFPLKSHMDKHLALHSPTSQVCKICNKTFANVYRLQRHMISHDESTDLRKFKCPTCGKAFKFKHHLKEHIRIHSGEKPFECANCGKRFSHSGSYSSHMNSKKCWVLNKGRRMDRTSGADTVNRMIFHPVGFSNTGSVSAPLQSPPPGAYPGQFLKYDARGPVVSTLYSPPMTTAGFAAAYNMLAAGKAIPLPAHHHPPSSLIPSSLGPAGPPITCPKPPELSSSPATNRTQISPDVNFNTQLFNLASGSISKILKDIAPKEDEEEKVSEEKGVKQQDVVADVKQEKEEIEEKKDGDKTCKERSVCRHCTKSFDSPIELHQHERYLCKQNKDIIQLMPGVSPTPPASIPSTVPSTPSTITTTDSANVCASPGSAASDRSRHATPNSSVCDTATDEEEEEGAASDSKKYRMRSLISDEQQTILKTKYKENPRPDKAELVRIATEVGFSKRVVQVWFQNMRARDRRRGKEVPYFPNMARFKANEISSSTGSSGITSTTATTTTTAVTRPYIPIVPQIFTSASLAASGASSNFGSSAQDLSTASNSSAELPLDLSMRRQPPKAHSNSSSPAPCSSSPFPCQDQALNLSIKSPSSTPVKEEAASEASDSSPHKTTTDPTTLRFQHSSIFKYLQQEGLIKSTLKVPQADCRNTFQNTVERVHIANNIRRQLERKAQNSPSKQSPSPPKSNGLIEDEPKPQDGVLSEKPTENDTADTESQQDDLELSGESRLVIDERCPEKEDDDMENEDEGEDSTDEEEEDEESCAKAEMFNAHHNLDTLATVATLEELKQHREGSEGKAKRVRRKSRQMESADFIHDLDDAVSTEDEDSPQRKRRKSWKGHKVDTELGMYACDQCDKMFSKQSSLARHKYEHSGARPFTCEVCTKAFKHKHHLTEHRRLHSGEKPFQCKKCGKRFSHSGSYSQHMNHRYKYCKPSDTEDE